MNWILDAEVPGFFDTVSHEWLIRFVEHRVGDRRVICLIRKWLAAFDLALHGEKTRLIRFGRLRRRTGSSTAKARPRSQSIRASI